MDVRAEKLAKARKKLRDHQEKKVVYPKEDEVEQNVSEQSMKKMTQIEPSKVPDLMTENITIENNLTDLYPKPDVNITEILISDKSTLELKINNLNSKVMQLEYLHESEINKNKILSNEVNALHSDLNNLKRECSNAINENQKKNSLIEELKKINENINDKNNNLLEQLEVTKTMLKTKESENSTLQNEIYQYHKQLEATKLQIQQLTNDSIIQINHSSKNSLDVEAVAQKVTSLKHEINMIRKEKEENNTHYEHYVGELNEQLRSVQAINEKYCIEIQSLQQRENGLIEQVSDLEIQLQKYGSIRENTLEKHNIDFMELEEKYNDVKAQLEDVSKKYDNLHIQYQNSLTEIEELNEAKEHDCNHENISISKLNADITSDKLAAQMATEQNKKLKLDIEDLELVVVKMTKDKLKLTEMLNHEKNLNKDLILKLTEIEESTKNINNTLRAKDEEMIRLQNGYREIEKKHGELLENMSSLKETTSVTCHKVISNDNVHTTGLEDVEIIEPLNNDLEINTEQVEDFHIPKTDAMHKLQERFFKIMNEVANLSDEKHRLEHIIMQLQNETDTICEYVALYQQQRSLLKKREEERNNQINIFQTECNQLKHHLEELRDIILMIIDDEKLTAYFVNENKQNDIVKIKHLLEILYNSSIIDPNSHKLDLNIFYPCNCCSGQLIDV